MSAYNEGDPGSIPGSGRAPGEGNGNPPQYSCLENPMDRGACYATVHGVELSLHYSPILPPALRLCLYRNPYFGLSYKWNHAILLHVCVYDWFLSLSIMFSGFIQVVAWTDTSFLFMAE